MPFAIDMASIMLHIQRLAASILLIAIAKDMMDAAISGIIDMINDLANVLPPELSILATELWFYRIRKGVHQWNIAVWQFLLSRLLKVADVVAILSKGATRFTFNILLAVIQIETLVAMPTVRSSNSLSCNWY
jgi:hypothetical protein